MSESAILEDSQEELPAHTPEPPPLPVERPRQPSAISQKDAIKAAKALGMRVAKVKAMGASRELGAYISQLGVVKIGRTMLVFSAEQLRDTIIQCDNVLSEVQDPELRSQLITTKKELLGQYITVANSLIKSAQVDASDGAEASLVPAFLPGQIVVPSVATQVNIGLKVDHQQTER